MYDSNGWKAAFYHVFSPFIHKLQFKCSDLANDVSRRRRTSPRSGIIFKLPCEISSHFGHQLKCNSVISSRSGHWGEIGGELCYLGHLITLYLTDEIEYRPITSCSGFDRWMNEWMICAVGVWIVIPRGWWNGRFMMSNRVVTVWLNGQIGAMGSGSNKTQILQV